MSRSEQIQTIPDKFKPLTIVKRGKMTTRSPHKFAEVCASLARSSLIQGEGNK